MIYTSKLTKKGQIVIPKSIQVALRLKPHAKVIFHVRNNADGSELIMRPVKNIMDLAGTFKPKRKPIDPVKARVFMEKHNERF